MKTEITALDKIRNRPRFKIYLQISPEQYSENLKKYALKNSEKYAANINREVATISVRNFKENYWKPTLSLRSESEGEKTVIRGVFGPSSAVWTFFMFLYFMWTILWMVFITLWFVGKQIKSSDFHWALPVSFIMLFLIALTYLAAMTGRKKAKNEMEMLRDFAAESTLPFEETSA